MRDPYDLIPEYDFRDTDAAAPTKRRVATAITLIWAASVFAGLWAAGAIEPRGWWS